MSKRRTHSTIDTLPADLRSTITAMVTDNAWPADWPHESTGHPTYDDIVTYCQLHGQTISRSAVGRWAANLRTMTRYRQYGELAKRVMADMDGDASVAQKAAAEMLTSVLIEYLANRDSFDPRDMKHMGDAISACNRIAIQADKHHAAAVAAKAQKADKAIKGIAKRKNLDPETLAYIRQQVYGIVDQKPES